MILEVVSSLPFYISGGDQMMPQGIIRNSLGDASRHHQRVKGFTKKVLDICWLLDT